MPGRVTGTRRDERARGRPFRSGRYDVFVTHDFPSTADAKAFAADPSLAQAMERAGVTSAPRIEIYEIV